MPKLIFLAVFLLILVPVLCLAQETFTLETYYPAPSGVYNDLEARNRFRMRGDADGDGQITDSDVYYLILRSAGSFPNDMFGDRVPDWVMDMDQDGLVAGNDISYLRTRLGGVSKILHIENFFNSLGALHNNGVALMVSSGNVGIGIRDPNDITNLLQVGTLPALGLLVTRGGNVGIGTDSPVSKLEVIGTISIGPSASGVDIQKTSGNLALRPGSGSVVRILNYNNNRYLDLYNESGIAGIRSSGQEPFTVQVNSNEKMRIQNDGNVGIGTTKPTQRLDVNGQVRIRQGVQGGGSIQPGMVLAAKDIGGGTADGTAEWQNQTLQRYAPGTPESMSQDAYIRIYDNSACDESSEEGKIVYKNDRQAGELCFCARGNSGANFHWFCLSSSTHYW